MLTNCLHTSPSEPSQVTFLDMSKAELVTSLAYDMATVTRLKENIDHFFSLFDIRNSERRPLQIHRVLCACIYFGICRLVYPTGLTLGEELTELVPSGTSRLLRPTQRLRWYIATVMPYVIVSLLPTTPLSKFFHTMLTDVWFSLSPNPRSTSFFEQLIKPKKFHPVCVHPDSGLIAPKWLFPVYGIITVIASTKEFLGSLVKPKHVHFAEAAGESCQSPGPPCAICMDPIVSSTATICGHVFCWRCIMDWCVSGELDDQGGVPCPTCRTSCKASDLVALVNYAPSSGKGAFWRRPIILNSNR